MKRPIPLETPNIELLKKVIEEYFDLLENEDTCEDTASDMDTFIIEAAIEALYGKNADDFIQIQHSVIENRD